MGETAQTYRPYKPPQGRLLLKMHIEVASLVSHCGRPSLLEHLSETTLFQMSEAEIGEIRTLLFMGKALDLKETCLKPISSQRWMTLSKTSGRRRHHEWKPYTKSYASCKGQTLRNRSDRPLLRNTLSMSTSSTPNKKGLNDGDLE